MKYIKKYKIDPKIGDYVIVDFANAGYENVSKILDIKKPSKMHYNIIIQTETEHRTYTNMEEIIRYATSKEIEDFILKIDTNKYNL